MVVKIIVALLEYYGIHNRYSSNVYSCAHRIIADGGKKHSCIIRILWDS
jgi:hypothetical protein